MGEYENLIKEKEYNNIAMLLLNDESCRKDNRVLIKKYYRKYHNLSLDSAFSDNDVPNYQSIERKARKLKQVCKYLRYDKTNEIDKYKQIGLDIPVVKVY